MSCHVTIAALSLLGVYGSDLGVNDPCTLMSIKCPDVRKFKDYHSASNGDYHKSTALLKNL